MADTIQKRNKTIKNWLNATKAKKQTNIPPPSFIPHYLMPNETNGFKRLTLKSNNRTEYTIYKNIDVQNFCFYCISRIDKLLYSPQFSTKLPSIHTYLKLFDFFLKGGNAIPILMPKTVHDLYPYSFTSDFDCLALVNPRIPPKMFTAVRENIMLEILKFIMKVVQYEVIWNPIWQAYASFGYKEDRIESTINIYNEALTPDDFHINEIVYENPEFRNWVIPKNCPFRIEIHPNLTFIEKQQGIMLIKLKTATIPSIDLIDIAIPSRFYEHINMDWDIHRLTRYDSSVLKLSFYMADILSSYIDQRIATLLDSRENKKRKRTMRANHLLNGIRSQLQIGTITINDINAYKRLPYKFLNNSISMADILSDI